MFHPAYICGIVDAGPNVTQCSRKKPHPRTINRYKQRP